MLMCTVCRSHPQMGTVVRCESCQSAFNRLRARDASVPGRDKRRAPTKQQLLNFLASGKSVTVSHPLKTAGHATVPNSRPVHPKRAEAYRLLAEARADEGTDAKGYVYCITDGTALKIGKSADHPQNRLKGLQTGNPRLLRLLGYKRVEDRAAEESALHEKHHRANILGEWFELDASILEEFPPLQGD